MSDFTIYEKNEKVDACYGMEEYKITKEDMDALINGKKLYTTINCGEYAIVIEMESKRRNKYGRYRISN